MIFLATDRQDSVTWDVNRDILTHFARNVSKSFTTRFLPEILPISIKQYRMNQSQLNLQEMNIILFLCFHGIKEILSNPI